MSFSLCFCPFSLIAACRVVHTDYCALFRAWLYWRGRACGTCRTIQVRAHSTSARSNVLAGQDKQYSWGLRVSTWKDICYICCTCYLVLSDLARISGICLRNATEHNAAKLEITRSQVRSGKTKLPRGAHFDPSVLLGLPRPCPSHLRAANVGGVHRPQDPRQFSPPYRMQESSGTDKLGVRSSGTG